MWNDGFLKESIINLGITCRVLAEVHLKGLNVESKSSKVYSTHHVHLVGYATLPSYDLKSALFFSTQS